MKKTICDLCGREIHTEIGKPLKVKVKREDRSYRPSRWDKLDICGHCAEEIIAASKARTKE